MKKFIFNKCFLNIFLVFLVLNIFVGNFASVNASKSLAPNEMGLIPMLEYHRIGLSEGDYKRSVENFKKDLEWLYNNDYVLIKVSDFIDQKINVPYGKKPVMMSFDDSTDNQFQYLENGEIDPDSAIGILDDFYQQHPDFGRSAIFYSNPSLFQQPELKKKKIDYLLATDREIGNHTYNHANLGKLTASELQMELGSLQEYINKIAGRDVPLTSVAYPFGAVPKTDDALKSLEKGKYNDTSYEIKTAFLVGADPTHPPYSRKFDALRVPRIQAIDEEWKRWFGRGPQETAKTPDSEIFSPFVSDGCEDVLTLPEKKLNDLDELKVNKGVEICISDKEDCEAEVALKCKNKPKKEINKADLKGEEEVVKTEKTDKVEDVIGEEVVNEENNINKIFGLYQDWQIRAFKKVDKWKGRFINLIPKVEVNKIPKELKFKDSDFYYLVQEGDSISSIVNKFIGVSSYYLPSQMREEFVKINKLEGGDLKVGEEVAIPNIEFFHIYKDVSHDVRKGIYWTAYTASSKEAVNQVRQLLKFGGNTVVFDLKETDGHVYYDSKLKFVLDNDLQQERIHDVPKLVKWLKRNGIYTIARITIFKDIALTKKRPDLAPKDANTRLPWSNREGVVWLDPSNEEVQNYNIDLAEEIAKFGVDEVQFDYVRFPEATRNTPDYVYDEKVKSREDIVVEFLEKAKKRLEPYDVKLSADLFGVVAWNNGFDGKIVGQNLVRMADHLDVIYPMIYPSHFGPGFNGYDNPGSMPYYFVNESMKKFMEQVEGKAEIIPWIQGFSWGATGYGTDYVRQQIKGAEDLEVRSFLIWNAANRYEVSFPAF